MKEDGTTKLEAYADGQTMQKRQSPRRKPSKPKGSTAKTTQKKQTTAPAQPKPIVTELPMEEQHNVVFKPNAGPQTDFLAAGEREVLYGGSAGGGKSYAMLADPLRFMGHPAFSGLLLRHTTEELR